MRSRLHVAALLLLLAAACAPQPLAVTREPVTLRVVVADACRPLVEDLTSSYEAARPWVTVTSVVYDTAEAEEVLRAGGADLALLSWLEEPASEDEVALWAEPFARDGIAVVVHPEAPLTEASLSQLRDIFNGHVQELGGVVLTVVSREEGSGTRMAFERIVLGGDIPTLNAVVMPSSEEVLSYVASTSGAIGYVSSLWLDERVRALSVEGVPPSEEAVAEGTYPLSRAFYLASMGEPTGEAREFAQWVLAGAGGLLEQ